MATRKRPSKSKTASKLTPSKRSRAITVRTRGANRANKAVRLERELKDVIPALNELGNPVSASFEKARQLINQLVLAPPSPKSADISLADKLKFIASVKLSVSRVPGYATLDAPHLTKIDSITKGIEAYLADPSQKRPHNILMLASPGAGKSHFIECLANRLASHGVQPITYNMASMQSNDDLVPPLDSARNLKVGDKVPLLFLDEFDSNPRNYALLLPLLWEGALNIGSRDLRLGKVVIVLAGSSPKLPETMDEARSMRDDAKRVDGEGSKLTDLFSRINGGVLAIPSFYDGGRQIDRRQDKVCIVVQLLKRRFGAQLTSVPVAFLRFVALAHFRYDVRSLAHLVDLIPFKPGIDHLNLKLIDLPLTRAASLKDSSLAYHLIHEDQASGIVDLWQQSIQNEASLPIRSQALEIIGRIPAGYLIGYIPYILSTLAEEDLS